MCCAVLFRYGRNDRKGRDADARHVLSCVLISLGLEYDGNEWIAGTRTWKRRPYVFARPEIPLMLKTRLAVSTLLL